MHAAKLISITEAKDVPPEVRPFVEFKAAVEGRELETVEKVAVLVIESTTCYVPVFLKNPPSMRELEKSLAAQDAALTDDSKAALDRHLRR